MEDKEAETHDSPISEQINDVVRSVAAFVGIAFAIVSLHRPTPSMLRDTWTLTNVTLPSVASPGNQPSN